MKNYITVCLPLSLIINPIATITSFTIVSTNTPPTISINTRTASTTSSALNLVPSQGCQLAAASAAAIAKIQELEEVTPTTSSTTTIKNHEETRSSDNKQRNINIRPSDATREFISRLFYRKSSSPNNNYSNSDNNTAHYFVSDLKLPSDVHKEITNKHNHNDVVYFPIVGFQYIKLQDGSIRGIPTMNALPEKAVCNFGALNKSRMEPLYGYYSPCCYLKDGDDA
jgi:hypothetical protein